MVILSHTGVAWTKSEQGTDMPCQMKDPSRENNFIIRTRAKQLRIKNKLNPDSRDKKHFSK